MHEVVRRLSLLVIALVVAGAGRVHAQAGEPKPTDSAAVVAAQGSLARLEAAVARLRLDIEVARRRTDEAPVSFAQQIADLRERRRALITSLEGQRWADIRPLLERADTLESALAGLSRRLTTWRAPVKADARRGRAPGTGAIAGRLQDARTGAAITFEEVIVYDAAGDFVGYGFTDGGGVYSVTDLAAGTYFVRTDTPDHLDELYSDIVCDPDCTITDGTPVVVIDGQTRSGIDFALSPLSAIEGVVLDTAQQPLESVGVTIYDVDGSWAGFERSGPDGRYRADRLLPGVYYAVARSDFYYDELYSQMPCQPECTPQSGTPILVGVDATTGNVDFSLELGGSVSGRVTDRTLGDPLSGVAVRVYDTSGALVGYGYTDQEGWYRVFDLPAGTYFARTDAYDHADELWQDLPCEPSCTPSQGTPITVVQGQEHAGIDFALRRLGSLSGVVSDAGSGAPLRGVYVFAFNAQGGLEDLVFTDDNGRYTVGGLPAGSYFVYTRSDAYRDELYNGLPCDPSCNPTTGTPITVTLDADTGGIDIALALGGWITGTVRAQATGAPIYDAQVTLYQSDGTYAASAYTWSDGTFRFQDLAAGAYLATASRFPYLPELYRELPCTYPCPPTGGTSIPVVLSQGTGGIDFTLTRLGRITGRVLDPSGLPVQTAVQVYNGSGTYVVGVYSSSVGFYLVEGLPAGSYFVATNTGTYGPNVVDELYDNKTCEPSCDVTQGTPVAVALDGTASGIDFALRRPVFADVPASHWAWRWVEAMYAAGLTGGCGTAPLRFCPDTGVSRAEMAVFLLRAKEGPAYLPPPAQGMFEDVPATDPFARWIEELARRGITGGCGVNPPRYCPGATTTRAQMAPLLLVTREGTGYTPPPAVGVFQDLPASNPFARWVEELVRRHVAGGCSTNPSLYCPGGPTNRAQMAVFTTATFGLPLP